MKVSDILDSKTTTMEANNPETTFKHQIDPRDLLAVVYCPTGAEFTSPAEVICDLPQEDATIRFRPPTAREIHCVSKNHGLPGLLCVVNLPTRQGDLLGHAFNAASICDRFLSSAFALTLADMRESFPVFICESTMGLKARPFIHFFADHLVMGRRSEIDPGEWSEQASTVFDQSSKRVLRAIRWLRKMHVEDDILDRFLAGWTGLETLNPELCHHYEIESHANETSDCKKCGAEIVRTVPRATGLKELFVREDKESIYKACSVARNGLVHGYKEIAELASLARQYTSEIGLMLAKGINTLSSINVPTDPEKYEWLNGYRIASFVYCEGTIVCGELRDYEKQHKELPLFEYSIRHKGGVVNEQTVLQGTSNITVPPACEVEMKAMGVSGPVTISDLKAN